MTLSDYQIRSVIRNYVRNMRGSLGSECREGEGEGCRDMAEARPSWDGMRRMVFERIGERMTERIKKHDIP